MHAEAYDWVSRYASIDPLVVLDIGGRNINGSPRPLFPNADWTTLDILAGADITADAATWTPDRTYNLVVCCEVFEHAERWPEICVTAYNACASAGLLLVTTAGPGRAVHSGVDGGPYLHPGEYYANVEPDQLGKVLEVVGWREIVVDQFGPDVRAAARR